MTDATLTELDDKWGWATEDADPDRLPDTLRRLELASYLASLMGDHKIMLAEVATLHAEGAIRG
jgi:hypothetical protein